MTPYKFCVTNKNTCTIHLFLCQLPFKKIVGDYCSNLHLVMQDGLRAQTPDQTNKHTGLGLVKKAIKIVSLDY